MGCALANPCSSARIAPEAWEGAVDLMHRVGWSETKIHACVKELKIQRRKTGRWSLPEITACNSNLLRCYKERRISGVLNTYANADEFVQLVFSLHVASAIIETFFSKTKYIKSIRNSTTNKIDHKFLTFSRIHSKTRAKFKMTNLILKNFL